MSEKLKLKAHILYRCRRCGVLFETAVIDVPPGEESHILRVSSDHQQTMRHECGPAAVNDSAGYGFADLAGYDLEED